MRRLAAALAGVALGGCGAARSAAPSAGRALFTDDCAQCHSLALVSSARQQGGPLGALHIARGAMLEFVREMPTPHPLSQAQLRAVADYVLAVEHRGG